jgi:hypothetical protein
MTNKEFRIIDKERFRHLVDRSAHFRRTNSRGQQVPANLPISVAGDMLAQRPLPVPEIAAIAGAPFFSPSGRLVVNPGYDAETKRWLDLPDVLVGLNIPLVPSQADIDASVACINDMLCDFPFVSPADKANARPMHDSITPLYLFSAPVAGTGKGLLVDALTIPATGHGAQRMTLLPTPSGTPTPSAVKLLGHSSIATTQRYVTVLRSSLTARRPRTSPRSPSR